MSNHDHCGTCPTMKKKQVNAFDSSMDISLCALQSIHSYPSRNAYDYKNIHEHQK